MIITNKTQKVKWKNKVFLLYLWVFAGYRIQKHVESGYIRFNFEIQLRAAKQIVEPFCDIYDITCIVVNGDTYGGTA